ncbi:hypothetical protein ACFU5O_20820 [Streptomyces sp. NPDC057445]|uniref:hypothetical protein n=1 Tax=Streptomyces sp. NPDC057445 TaxID=3346136 RepID=UPI003680EF86
MPVTTGTPVVDRLDGDVLVCGGHLDAVDVVTALGCPAGIGRAARLHFLSEFRSVPAEREGQSPR